MKRALLFCVLMTLMLMAGCAPRMPVAKVVPVKVSKPIPESLKGRPQEIAMPTLPFRPKTADQKVIVLDAGHGGEDFGTSSLGSPKYQEKYLNMSTTQMVKNFLQQYGYKVVLTRTDDTFISLDNRAKFANAQNPILFVSIHYNSAPSKEAEGIEVFYYRNEDDKTRMVKSKALAQAVLDKVLRNTNAKSRGVKHGNYAVIRQTTMPAILIEGGFLTNSSEMEKLKDAGYLKNLALGIAQGIQDYLAKQNILAEK